MSQLFSVHSVMVVASCTFAEVRPIQSHPADAPRTKFSTLITVCTTCNFCSTAPAHFQMSSAQFAGQFNVSECVLSVESAQGMAKKSKGKKTVSYTEHPNAPFKCVKDGTELSFQSGVSTACRFPPSIFLSVMLNLIKNPNITSSHLFRADIMYDSENDVSFAPLHNPDDWIQGKVEVCKLAAHMKPQYKPRPFMVEGWTMSRMLVRELVPRNPNIDKPMAQTCCMFERRVLAENCDHSPWNGERSMERHEHDGVNSVSDDEVEPAGSHLVVYVPHIDQQEDMPYYHPKVRALAFLFDWLPRGNTKDATASEQPPHERHSGELSLHPSPFDTSQSSADRVSRVLIHILSTVSRHGQGRLEGYTKRVNHDAIIPQARFQTTYTRLKLKYAARLAQDWREVTDPTKHVFEDLGIAAFLVELWHDLYGIDPEATREEKARHAHEGRLAGFVDIGCGNGVLVAILRWEGYEGWGFDIRRRKSWDAFKEDGAIRGCLLETILVPRLFQRGGEMQEGTHDGIFPPNTFIVSNHADELTPWTPVLGRLSHYAPFIAIPCCSHDFGGARTRFPMQKKKKDAAPGTSSASAYQTLCDYVERLSSDMGYSVQREHLRIPSTRNVGFVGLPKDFVRHCDKACEPTTGDPGAPTDHSTDEELLRSLIEKEMKGVSIDRIATEWRGRADRLRQMKGDPGH